MQADLAFIPDFSLKQLNTFGIAARARAYLKISDTAQLGAVLAARRADPALAALPLLLLGGGSNILLTRDFDGLLLHMAIMGREIVAADRQGEGQAVLVRAGAGENWHDFVQYTLAQGLGGLENLSLIPGTVGASPIQNIGAYGAEIKDVFHSLTVFDLASGQLRSMDGAACRFGYRDSIFKRPEGVGLVIVDVTFALLRQQHWRPNLRYAELALAVQEALGKDGPGQEALGQDAAGQDVLETVTPQQVSDTVIAIRRRKLPDPAQIGNAGSFFKNPVVSKAHCATLLAQHPGLVHHAQPDGSEKLAAGWLIDQCGWKGRSMGAAGVYPKQALVLVNHGGASGADIVALAEAIKADVRTRYGVQLEIEPVTI